VLHAELHLQPLQSPKGGPMTRSEINSRNREKRGPVVRQHVSLYDAIGELEETHIGQTVEIPHGLPALYYQRYAHTLAKR
jgi:hypothetical protein